MSQAPDPNRPLFILNNPPVRRQKARRALVARCCRFAIAAYRIVRLVLVLLALAAAAWSAWFVSNVVAEALGLWR